MKRPPQPIILVAEDNSNDARLLEWAFKKAGISKPLRFVHNGAEAMDYLLGLSPFDDRAQYPFPDLIIVDWKMPRVDGCELLSWLQRLPGLNQLPVAAMSGASWEQDFECARSVGVKLFLNKWVEFSQLVLTIKQLVSGILARERGRAEGAVKEPEPAIDGHGHAQGDGANTLPQRYNWQVDWAPKLGNSYGSPGARLAGPAGRGSSSKR